MDAIHAATDANEKRAMVALEYRARMIRERWRREERNWQHVPRSGQTQMTLQVRSEYQRQSKLSAEIKFNFLRSMVLLIWPSRGTITNARRAVSARLPDDLRLSTRAT